MFGLVTKRELDQLRADLVLDIQRGRDFEKELQYEWAKWFNKFRSLYAMLLKREKSAGESQSPDAGDADRPTPDAPPRLATLKRGLRGF